MELGSREAHTMQILLAPSTEESLELAKQSLDGGIEANFDGWARVSVWGQEESIPIAFDEVISVYGALSL